MSDAIEKLTELRAAREIAGMDQLTSDHLEKARAVLSLFKNAHTPTDDEREALNKLYWTHPDGHTTGLSSDAIDAILASEAWRFRRTEVPEPSAEDRNTTDDCQACNARPDQCSRGNACCEDCNHAACWGSQDVVPLKLTPQQAEDLRDARRRRLDRSVTDVANEMRR